MLIKKKIPDDIPGSRSQRFKLVHYSREVVIHDAVAAGEQAMGMRRLRNAPAQRRTVRQQIALDDSDSLEMAAECFGSQETAHAGAEHNGRLTTGTHQ